MAREAKTEFEKKIPKLIRARELSRCAVCGEYAWSTDDGLFACMWGCWECSSCGKRGSKNETCDCRKTFMWSE
jgi:hypothetical protein